MPNWDDQFDFQDIDQPKKNSKNVKAVIKNKAVQQDDDFFDLDGPSTKKQSKSILPTINSRQSANLKSGKSISSNNKYNPYADKVFGSKANPTQQQNYYDQQIADQQQPKPKAVISKQYQQNSIKNLKNDSKVSQQYEDNYQDDYQQSIKEIKPKIVQNKLTSKQPVNHPKEVQKKIVKQIQKKITPIQQKKYQSLKLNQKKSEDDYQEEFQNDQYNDQQFQQSNKSPVKPAVQKVQQKINQFKNVLSRNSINQKSQAINNFVAQKPKLQITSQKQQVKGSQVKPQKVVGPLIPKPPLVGQRKNSKLGVVSNKNMNKIQSASLNKVLVRSSSRQSIRSNQSRQLSMSRSTKNDSQYIPNKHLQLVEKSFPQSQDKLGNLSQVQINKVNQKMRSMIRKFNQELNDLISKNMLLLKNKQNSKIITTDQKLKQLQIQKKTGDTAIDVMEKQFDKLHGRQGQLKQQQYQLILQKRIQEKKNQIKQTIKAITDIKRQVDSKGKKLSHKQQQQRDAQSITHLKTILIQNKKDEQKGDQRIQKLTTQQQQLQAKVSDMQYKLDELISQARQKGINIENQQVLMKKYQQSKKRLQMAKNFNKKSQSLYSTKIDILNHQNQQIRITIRHISSQINNLYGSIDHSQNQSIKMIQKAKQRSNINLIFAQNLDKLLKVIEQSKANTDYFQVRSQVKSRRSDSSRHQTKKLSNDNIQKSMPLRVAHDQNRMIQNDQLNNVKPKFMKKKPNQQAKFQIQNKNHQRVWNQPQNENHKNSPLVVQKPVEKVQPPIIDKSKPFSIKKNKMQNLVQIKKQQIIQNQIKIPIVVPLLQDKKEQTLNISIAPRMMKFGRKKNQQTSKNQISLSMEKAPQIKVQQKSLNSNIKNPIKPTESIKLEIKQEIPKVQEQTQKPIFAPKRFNLRNKGQKKDQGYMPTVQNTSSHEIQKVPQPPKKVPVQQYKPKFDFKAQELPKTKQQPKIQLQIEKPIVVEEQVKPRFNLRLRDKMKKNDQNATDSYMPTSNKNVNDQNKYQQPSNSNNPYAPKKLNVGQNEAVNINLNNNTNQAIVNNPYAPKQSINPVTKLEPTVNPVINRGGVQPTNRVVQPINNPYNPYAPKQSVSNQPLKIQKQGPLKKNKLISNQPKQKINIYDQAQDITNDVSKFGQPTKHVQPSHNTNNTNNNMKSQELDLNAMLGIKKQAKKNDFDQLLGDVGVAKVNKNKKKQNDFFGDMEI